VQLCRIGRVQENIIQLQVLVKDPAGEHETNIPRRHFQAGKAVGFVHVDNLSGEGNGIRQECADKQGIKAAGGNDVDGVAHRRRAPQPHLD